MTPKENAMYLEYLNDIRSKGQRSFSIDQLINDLEVSYEAAKSGLYRLSHDKKIISPAKGLYVILPPEYLLLGSLPAQELVPILMNYLNADYYVGLLSAANYYGASHQKSGNFQIITNKRMNNNFTFGQIKLEIIYKKSLNLSPKQNIAVPTGYLNIATPELVIMDLFLYPRKSGGLNHIATILSELVDAIDPEKLIALAKLTKEKFWLQRLGYILEKIETMNDKKQQKIIDKVCFYLKDNMRGYLALDGSIAITGMKRNDKWHIAENTTIESDL